MRPGCRQVVIAAAAHVERYDHDTTQEFLKLMNAMPPQTSFAGDNMVVLFSDASVLMGFDEPGEFCRIMARLDRRVFAAIIKRIAGEGV